VDDALLGLATLKVPGTRLAVQRSGQPSQTEAIVIKSLLVGAVVGGAVVWVYGDRIRDYIDDVTMNVRERAAARLDTAAERLQTVADTVEDGLSKASRRAS
jgi:hypothetical protein